ncbi:MAG: hypothetical protein RBT37_05705 [Dissulfurispiraceae bacterium]|nr:hypothetical protein [Dissulfurispiraceae bacterium]
MSESEIKKTLVRSFYNKMLVTSYEKDGIIYVANQHGNWDVYEGGYERGSRTRTVPAAAEEITKIISEHKKQSGGK